MPELRDTQGKIKKQKSHAFDKDCYLLGVTQYDEPIWLEAAQWDCG